MPMKQRHSRLAGFTLIEMVMVIIILGVIGAMVAVFMKKPVDAYFDAGRRATLTDVADTAVRRIGRDVRRALPNSLRLPGADQCIEFIPTKTGGRYRALPDIDPGAPAPPGELSFSAVDTSFNMLGDNDNPTLPVDQRIVVGDVIAIYNLGIPGADAYNLDNTDTVSAVPVTLPSRVVGADTLAIETQITTTGRVTPYPLASPNNRFHVIPATEQVVSYVCTFPGVLAGEGLARCIASCGLCSLRRGRVVPRCRRERLCWLRTSALVAWSTPICSTTMLSCVATVCFRSGWS